VPTDFDGIWYEPFMGTGVVGFNIAPQQGIFGDCNPHLVNFYRAIRTRSITPTIVRKYLTEEGSKLLELGESHYYAIRDRFNQGHDPLDFLFLSRAGFNGMIRFNQKGGYNVPFCRKPDRFAPAYITKIVNQVNFVSKLLKMKDFSFVYQDFSETIEQATEDDIIYCDPPYIGRHVDYFSGWDEAQEFQLFEDLSHSPAKFILSTWHHNDYRENEYIHTLWNQFNILTREHFYHVGASEKNRSPMVEAIVTNFDLPLTPYQEPQKAVQLAFLEEKAKYSSG
jgi:DNA adenine methylase